MKYDEKNEEKVFTKKESNDIIKKDYNPLKVNEKIYEKGSGLLMKDITLSKFVEERIKENKKLFTTKELVCINSNKECINKIYLLGCKNAKECYEKK